MYGVRREQKCEGLQHIRRLSKNHPDTLALQLHAVTLAVIAEVFTVVTQYIVSRSCVFYDDMTCANF